MHNNTRSKAVLRVLSGKTRSANEERQQLRRAAVIHKHGEHANINAILAVEDRLMKMENAMPNVNKHNSRKVNNHNTSRKANKPNTKTNTKAPKKWATVKTHPVRR